MINLNEDDLKAAIVDKATDELLANDSDLTTLISREIRSRIDKLFAERVNSVIDAAIREAVDKGFEREYQKVNYWGQPEGEKTTIKRELERIVQGYWSTKVDKRNGSPSESYGAITRAEYMMLHFCGQSLTEEMKKNMATVTGALKDSLRGFLAEGLNSMCDSMLHVKSLQDQGLADNPLKTLAKGL